MAHCLSCQSLFGWFEECLLCKENWNQDANDIDNSNGSVRDCSTIVSGSSNMDFSSVTEGSTSNQSSSLNFCHFEETPKGVIKEIGNRNEKSAMREAHPDLRKDLIGAASALRMIFSILLGAALALGICNAILALREDLTKKREQENILAKIETQQCLKDFLDNGCDARKPALETYCSLKEKCFSQDYNLFVKSSRLTASLIAEVLNDFVKPLEFKTLCFLFCLILGINIIWISRSGSPGFDQKRILEEIHSKLGRTEKRSPAESITGEK